MVVPVIAVLTGAADPLGGAVEESLDEKDTLAHPEAAAVAVLEGAARKAVTNKPADRRDVGTETDSSMETAKTTTNKKSARSRTKEGRPFNMKLRA